MTLLKIFAIALAAVGCFFFFIQRSMIFPAPDVELPGQLPDFVEHVPLEEGYALLLSPSLPVRTAAPLLIYAHGNAGSAVWQMHQMIELRDAGFYVLLLEYPGYAGAPGSPSLKSIERSALAAYDLITQRSNIDSTRVIAYGRSIGGGAATLIAKQRPVAALGLESSFTRLSSLVAENGYPSFLLRDRFDNETVVRNLNVPVFLYHGSEDDLIPISHSEKLGQVANNHAFFQAPCGHNDCPPGWRMLLEFLRNQDVL